MRANPDAYLLRWALVLAIGCIAVAHGTAEHDAAVFDLGESHSVGAEVQDSEIELKVRESHPEYSSFNINADTQEDRIAMVPDIGAAEDGTSGAKSRTATVAHPTQPTLKSEIEAIQGTDDNKEPSLIGESADVSVVEDDSQDDDPSEAVDSASESSGKTSASQENSGKSAEAAAAAKSATDTAINNEKDQQAKAEEAREAQEKAMHKAAENREKVREAAEQREEEEDAEKATETKAKDEQKGKTVEARLEKSQKSAEKEAKAETAQESKDKTEEQNEKTSMKLEKQKKMDEQRTEQEKMQKQEVSDKKAEELRVSEEEEKAATGEVRVKTSNRIKQKQIAERVKEKGDKAYDKEMSIENKKKKELARKAKEEEKVAAGKESEDKETAAHEGEEKADEAREKTDERAHKLEIVSKKTEHSAQEASQAANDEKASKNKAEQYYKDLKKTTETVRDEIALGEAAMKTKQKAFTKAEKMKANKAESLAKSRVGEAESKERAGKSDYKKSLATRETTGKNLSERTEKSYVTTEERLAALKKEKKLAEKLLENAQRARAEVYKDKVVIEERDDKEFANKVDGKEQAAKARIEHADSVVAKIKELSESTSKREKAEQEAANKREEKDAKFDKTHVETNEKKLMLMKVRVAEWIKEDKAHDAKLVEMQSWEKNAKDALNTNVGAEAKAKQDVTDSKNAAERAEKKTIEIQEKETMGEQFNELIEKDNEKARADGEKKIKDENEKVAKDKAAKARTAEAVEKDAEVVQKTNAKVHEDDTKAAESEEKQKQAAVDSKERNQKAAVAVNTKMKDKAYGATLKEQQTKLVQKVKSLMSNIGVSGEAEHREKVSENQDSLKKVQKAYQTWKEGVEAAEQAALQAKKDADAAEGSEKKDIKDDRKKQNDAMVAEEKKREQAQKLAEKKLQQQADAQKIADAKAEEATTKLDVKGMLEKATKDQAAATQKRKLKEEELVAEEKKVQERKEQTAQLKEDAMAEENKLEKAQDAATTAADTLSKQTNMHKEWKVELAKKRKAETDAREKELKVLPHRLAKAQQEKYSTTQAASQKAFMDAKKAFSHMFGMWTAKETKMKSVQAKERTLSDEKKLLFKSLADAVKQEYHTSKEVKAKTDAYDESVKKAKLKSVVLQVRIGNEQVYKKEKTEAETSEKEAAKILKEQKDADKQENQSINDQLKQDQMQGEQAELAGVKNQGAKSAIQIDQESKQKETAKAALAEEEKHTALEKKKKEEEDIKKKEEAAMSVIVDLKAELKAEASEKKSAKASMDTATKMASTAVETLRGKERTAKEGEIAEKSQLKDIGAKEEELRAEKDKLDEVQQMAKHKLERDSKNVQMIKRIVQDKQSHEDTFKIKEKAVKGELEDARDKVNAAQKADQAAKEDSTKADVIRRAADAQRALSMQKRNAAVEDEKKSKNDSLEKNQKNEAAGITRAIEAKNKAQETSVKAFKVKADLMREEYTKAEERDAKVKKHLARLLRRQKVFGKKNKIRDTADLKKKVSDAEDGAGGAEKESKKAEQEDDKIEQESIAAMTKADQAREHLDKMNAILTKEQTVLGADRKSQEGAEKAHTIAEGPMYLTTQESLTKMEALVTKAMDAVEQAKANAKGAEAANAQAVEKLQYYKHSTKSARQRKIDAEQAATAAQNAFEAVQKQEEKFEAISDQIKEWQEKKKDNQPSLAESEKGAKRAEDDYKMEAQKCEKIKDAHANVGKAYERLSQEMKEWAEKNPWLKQDAQGKGAASGDVGEDVGEVEDDVDAYVSVDSSDDIGESHDPTIMPPWARRSFVQLLQEDYGTDVNSILNSR